MNNLFISKKFLYFTSKQTIMVYKESDYIKEQYATMSIARLKFTVQNGDEYLSAHVERCEQELKSRGL